jgi:hypothetical protein
VLDGKEKEESAERRQLSCQASWERIDVIRRVNFSRRSLLFRAISSSQFTFFNLLMKEIRGDDSARGSGLPAHFEIVDGELLELGIGAAQRKLRHPSPGAIIQLRSDEPFMVSGAYLLRTGAEFLGDLWL